MPRHPERGRAVAALAEGLAVARRGAGELPGPATAVYVTDTLGELGLAYRLASVALVGGSLVPHGGQNPLEPARLGCPILLGPWTGNFADPVARLLAGRRRGAAGRRRAGALAAAAQAVLCNQDYRRALAKPPPPPSPRRPACREQVAEALLRLLPDTGAGTGRAETAL